MSINDELSVSAYNPIGGDLVLSSPIVSFDESDLVSYSHTIEAVGGFSTATIEVAVDVLTLSMWLNSGLGRHIVVHGPGGAVAWEGFVNQIEANMSGLSMSHGPLMEVSNKVKVKYQTISWDIPDTPVRGLPGQTAYANDTLSQERYFVLEEIVNIGEASEVLNQPTAIRDTYLNEFAWPVTSQAVTLLPTEGPTVTLNCMGYFNLFKKFYYQKTGTVSSMNASAKIIDVVEAEPNSIVADTARVEVNTTPVAEHEDGESTGWDVILDTISFGTSNNYRYIVGMDENRTLYGKEIALDQIDLDYIVRVRSNNPVIGHYPGGGSIPKMLVRPGNWIVVTDTIATYPGSASSLVSHRDPRTVFIESVSYEGNGEIVLSSTTQRSVDRAIARIGLDTLYVS